MNKFKFDIQKNNISWEKNSFKKCDSEKCNEKGEYKAPKSRIKLNQYFFFCLKHIKEYNKSWDFYKGMTVDEIEFSMRNDTVWDRPSWPLKGNYKNTYEDLNIFIDDFVRTKSDKNYDKYFKNKLIDESLTLEAVSYTHLTLPTTVIV